jgi:hypothetical protein
MRRWANVLLHIERTAGARRIAENYLRFVAVYERAKAPVS